MLPENATVIENPATRDLKLVKPAAYPEYVDRWAIIVGISKYKHERLNLKYAHRDAEELYLLIQTPSGGGFAKDHIEPLIDEKATTANITRALRSFLKKPAKDDIVLIYFACHGAPDPERPSDVYLLTHDTDPKDIAGTALPMREIDLSLKEKLLAQRVVILADTCHSAAIGGGIGRRSGVDHSAVVNRYLQEVSQANSGVALLTSAAANEVSFEDEKWDGGHGVFTHYLLKGMKGDADGYSTKQPKDGKVTAGELFDYVRENVERETGNQQHPSLGTNAFDRNLPMAITGGITAHEHYQLGSRLYELGWLLDDDGRFESAIRQFNEALRLTRLSGVSFPEAHFQHGRSLMALGRFKEAVAEFNKTLAADEQKQFLETYLHLGVAYAEQRDNASAIKAFEQFVQLLPQNENAAWVEEYLKMLKSEPQARKRALLIGIDQYPDSPLEGCKNDVELMKTVLASYGFQEFVILTDEEATKRAIENALTQLASQVLQNDLVVIYYAGSDRLVPDEIGISHTGSVSALVPIDHEKSGLIDSVAFHRLVERIPAANINIIIDSCHSGGLKYGRTRREGYNLLVSCQEDQLAAAKKMDDKDHGVFTYFLCQQLRLSKLRETTYDDVLAAVGEKLYEKRFQQTPGLIGHKDQNVFGLETYDFPFFDLSSRGKNFLFTKKNLTSRYARFKSRFSESSPKTYYFFGKAFFEEGNYQQAVGVMQSAIDRKGTHYPEAELAISMAAANLQNYGQSIKSLQSYLGSVDSPEVIAKLREAMNLAENLKNDQKHALLIGIDEYKSSSIPQPVGAEHNVQLIKKTLIDKLGFIEGNIQILINDQATREAIMDSFKKMVAKTFCEPALFYFSGNGSEAPDGSPTIVSVDGRQNGINDINLGELSRLASGEDKNIIAMIDAGWRDVPNSRYNFRVLPKDQHLETSFDDQNESEVSTSRLPQIGLLTVHAGLKSAVRGERDAIPFVAKDNKLQGVLARAFSQVLAKEDYNHLNLAQFIESLKKATPPLVPTDAVQQLDRKLFSRDLRNAEKLQALLRHIEKAGSLNNTIQALRQSIQQRNETYPEGFLNLGIVYAAQENYDESIKAFEKAIAQDERHDYLEARYYLGRVLLESQRDLPRAVSELREVTRQQPNHIAAHYFLGKALQALIERESLVEVENAFKIYLDKGAPLGNEDEVKDFLSKRQDSEENLKKTRTDAEEFQKKVLELLRETESQAVKKKPRPDNFRLKVLELIEGSKEKPSKRQGPTDKEFERLLEKTMKKFEKQHYWIEV